MKNSSTRPRDDGRAAKRAAVYPEPRISGWFRDEVAIDFPSLDEALERMRDAFLAPMNESDAQPELSAELRISPREAFHGVTLPLDVPIRKLCGACGGRGENWPEPCEACDGTGHAIARHPVRLVVPPRVRDGDRFCLSVCAPSASPTRVEVRLVVDGR
jgi:DnaJ-class molecular chaperone